MKEKYKNILLQGWMFDCLDLMDKEEQDKYFAALLRSALEGKVLTDNDKWTYLLEKALSSIEETREAYYQKASKIGMKGKEYGIEGKEYGIEGKEHGIEGKNYGPLGGDYGHRGGRPRKRPDVYEKIYNFILSDENYIKSALSEDKTQKTMLCRNIKTRIPEVAENNDENSKLINGVIKRIKEENNNNNGDNKVQ